MACSLQVTQCAELGPGPIPRSAGETELAYRQAAGRPGVILTVSERVPRWRPEGIPAGAAGLHPRPTAWLILEYHGKESLDKGNRKSEST